MFYVRWDIRSGKYCNFEKDLKHFCFAQFLVVGVNKGSLLISKVGKVNYVLCELMHIYRVDVVQKFKYKII